MVGGVGCVGGDFSHSDPRLSSGTSAYYSCQYYIQYQVVLLIDKDQ